jgi:hypothetical protein
MCSFPIFAQSVKGMSFNGATGLVSIPTGKIGWEKSNFAIDLGYHAIISDETAHIPKIGVSLFKWVEASFAYDSQYGQKNEDMIITGKLGLPTKGTSVAIGGNFQLLKHWDTDYNASQIYLAASYPATFFKMPAETTIVVGKTFTDANNSNIDFGMGFDLLLFPEIFERYVHWLIDFANFSYSLDAYGADYNYRGVFNTGIRIDIAANKALSKYKFVLDAIITDAFDSNRAFALGLTAGFPIQ